MVVDLSQINILTRLEIEARIAGPLIRAFIDELGRDKAHRSGQSGNQVAGTGKRRSTG